MICTQSDAACLASAQAITATPSIELAVHKRAWGIDLPARTYRIYLKLPG
jgi:hypothetical protein